ncbi:MAG TPA: hypothetical protein VGS62_04025 [Streptosporangiaceae bacterium]|nr:hypothetical protein [Streptosporangiaceae bacterium]
MPAVVFLMVGASPALASAPAHHPVLAGHLARVPNISNGEHLCAALNTNLCLHGNGTYNQMTIETSDLTDITFTQVPRWPTGTYFLTNAGGNCIRENSSNRVNVEASGCSITDLNEIWALYQDGTAGYHLVNQGQNNLMVVDGMVAGYKVWGGGTSQDWHWFLCSGGWCIS